MKYVPEWYQKAILHILMPTIGQLSLEETVKSPTSTPPFLVEVRFSAIKKT